MDKTGTSRKRNMTKIEQLLMDYKENKAKLKMADLEIEGLEEMLHSGKLLFSEKDSECIEGISMKARAVNGMPKNIDNRFRSTTEDAALNYHNESVSITDPQSIRERIVELKNRTYLLRMDVCQVETALELLTREQRFIVEQYYIEGYNWHEIEEQYELNFRFRYTERTLQTWRDKAIKKMESVIRKCS